MHQDILSIAKLRPGTKNLLILCMMIIGSDPGTCTYAQPAFTSALASVTIIKPAQLLNVRDMNFGNVAAGETSGTVILYPTAASPRTATGGVTLPSGSGTVQSAKFILSGEDGYSFSIKLPSEIITLSSGVSFMTLDTFTSLPLGPGILNSGSETLYVGATLNINANQEPGTYKTTKDFEILVNYE
jgi:hypothetical protein